MNAVRPIAVKLDQDTRDRLKRLADAKDRSTHWMLREAVAQFVEREEKREAFRQAGLQAWREYQATGKHVTHGRCCGTRRFGVMPPYPADIMPRARSRRCRGR